ncbi:MAG: phosphotransferase, partial [Desulfobacterales bacterium]|nr:phosphotransferase [Desulfobacterales bacterium]
IKIVIHGDFNVNNIVYNKGKKKINFIDLYRSSQFDYIQDASVFLVSNFRLPVFERRLRDRLNSLIKEFYGFFKEFASDKKDTTFEIRMALALARSFFTSARFELNYSFSKNMVMRAHYLMEKIVGFQGESFENFKLPESILYY